MNVIAPSTRSRATSGTHIEERSPSSRNSSSSSGVSVVASTSSSSVISEKSSGLRVRITLGTPYGASGSGGYFSASSSASRTFSGSTCAIARRLSDPSGSSMSIAHQSANWDTARAATFASVRSYSSDEASCSLACATKRWSSASRRWASYSSAVPIAAAAMFARGDAPGALCGVFAPQRVRIGGQRPAGELEDLRQHRVDSERAEQCRRGLDQQAEPLDLVDEEAVL